MQVVVYDGQDKSWDISISLSLVLLTYILREREEVFDGFCKGDPLGLKLKSVLKTSVYLFQARFLLSKVNPSQTHNNMYAYGGVSTIVQIDAFVKLDVTSTLICTGVLWKLWLYLEHKNHKWWWRKSMNTQFKKMVTCGVVRFSMSNYVMENSGSYNSYNKCKTF